jgi:hypothetical protein
MTIKLYDLRNNDYPREEIFHSLQVFKCSACGVRWNRTGHLGSCLSTHGRVIAKCPHRRHPWHERAVALHACTRAVHPKAYQEAAQQELTELLREAAPVDVLVGDPVVDWIAGVQSDGYLIDGVVFYPDGDRQMARSERNEPHWPPFVEGVFERVAGGFDETIRECLQEEIRLQSAFEQATHRMEQLDQEAPEVRRQLRISLHSVYARIDAVFGESRTDKVMPEFHRRYRNAYWQWRVGQHLAEHGPRVTPA